MPLHLRTVSNRAEGTFGRLRYILGGDRPSQTAHLTLSACRNHGQALEAQYTKGGIPRTTPPRLASRLHSLPPILDNVDQTSISSCSKGSTGSFRLAAGIGIFTDTTFHRVPR